MCEKDDCMFTKVVIDEEEWDGIDIDNIGNLEDLLILAFIYEEYGNLKVVVDGGELLEILTKRRSQTFCNPIFVHSVKNVAGENISSISKWNIVNQLHKYDFFVVRFC